LILDLLDAIPDPILDSLPVRVPVSPERRVHVRSPHLDAHKQAGPRQSSSRMPQASRQKLVEQNAVTERKMACFQRVEKPQFHKNFLFRAAYRVPSPFNQFS
jgi:hypothetical protein